MKTLGLCCGLLLIFTAPAFAQATDSTSATNTSQMSMKVRPIKQTMGDWTLMCISSSLNLNFPAQIQANVKDVKMCTAQQSVTQKIEHKSIEATIHVSPILISMLVKNVTVQEHSSQLIIGTTPPVKMNAFCSKIANQSNCFFTLANHSQNKNTMAIMAKNNQMTLRFKDMQTQRPIAINFSLKRFNDIYQMMQHSEQTLKHALQPKASSDQTSN